MRPLASISPFPSRGGSPLGFTELPMARTIAVANLKGGVGKTTTTISLGAALAEKGYRVLLVDLDIQQDLCASLEVPTPRPGLADVLFNILLFERAELSEAFVEAHGMTVAGGYGLQQLEMQLNPHKDSESALKFALASHLDHFDIVLLDCSPSIGYLTRGALMAADDVLIPIQTEFLALNDLPGIVSAVTSVKERLNPRLKIAGFLPTMYDGRTRHALEILEEVAAQAKRHGVPAFNPIPKTIRLAEASASGRPITQYAPESSAALAYRKLAIDIERCGLKNATASVASPAVFSPPVASVSMPRMAQAQV